MSDIRSLIEPKNASIIKAASAPPLAEMATLPTAVEQTRGYTLPLTCSRTGLTIGSLNIATVAGHMPMIGQWKDTMVLHPLFSLAPTALLHFSKNAWFRYCAFTQEEAASERLVDKQEELLRVAALAMMYHMTEIRQDIPWLPSFADVGANWSSLMALSYWKNYLDSSRFRFPHIHIGKLETPELRSYLQACWNVKKAYENNVNEKIEIEKLKAAEAAQIALRDMLAGARPTSVRQLWRWFLANMPSRYKKDLEGWMAEIFFSKGEEIRRFTIRDIDLLEEYFLCECPTGTAVSHAFSEVLASKRAYLQQHFETFEIILPVAVQAAKDAGTISAIMPKREDYPSKVGYAIALAKWKLAHTDLQSNMNAALAKQKQQTVVTSTKAPILVIREDDDMEDDVEEEAEATRLDSIEEDAAEKDADHSGEYET
jgi:hypothetical protein